MKEIDVSLSMMVLSDEISRLGSTNTFGGDSVVAIVLNVLLGYWLTIAVGVTVVGAASELLLLYVEMTMDVLSVLRSMMGLYLIELR